jgi:hypothetical protein
MYQDTLSKLQHNKSTKVFAHPTQSDCTMRHPSVLTFVHFLLSLWYTSVVTFVHICSYFCKLGVQRCNRESSSKLDVGWLKFPT